MRAADTRAFPLLSLQIVSSINWSTAEACGSCGGLLGPSPSQGREVRRAGSVSAAHAQARQIEASVETGTLKSFCTWVFKAPPLTLLFTSDMQMYLPVWSRFAILGGR